MTKEEIASKWTGKKLEVFTDTEELDFIHPLITPKQCLRVMEEYAQQAIAGNERGKWTYLPEYPVDSGKRVLVEYRSIGMYANCIVQFPYEINSSAIRWCELPEPYQEEKEKLSDIDLTPKQRANKEKYFNRQEGGENG